MTVVTALYVAAMLVSLGTTATLAVACSDPPERHSRRVRLLLRAALVWDFLLTPMWRIA